jgi:hypothetical protein
MVNQKKIKHYGGNVEVGKTLMKIGQVKMVIGMHL